MENWRSLYLDVLLRKKPIVVPRNIPVKKWSTTIHIFLRMLNAPRCTFFFLLYNNYRLAPLPITILHRTTAAYVYSTIPQETNKQTKTFNIRIMHAKCMLGTPIAFPPRSATRGKYRIPVTRIPCQLHSVARIRSRMKKSGTKTTGLHPFIL